MGDAAPAAVALVDLADNQNHAGPPLVVTLLNRTQEEYPAAYGDVPEAE